METPTFYTMLPAAVRYDKNLKPNEKLLFAEISALTNVTGYCYASNAYFQNLFDASTRTVQGWLKHLQDCGYISIIQVGGGAGEQRAERRISPLTGMAVVPQTPAKYAPPPQKIAGGPPQKNAQTPRKKMRVDYYKIILIQERLTRARARMLSASFNRPSPAMNS